MKRWVTFDVGEKSLHLQISTAYPNVLTGGDPGRIEKTAQYLDNCQFARHRGFVTVHGTYKSMPVTAFSTGIGVGSVSATLPEVIEACDDPSMNIIRVGTAGGLQDYLHKGDFVVTTTAVPTTTAGETVMGPDYNAVSSPLVTGAIEKAARCCKNEFQTVHVGPTQVTGDIYFNAAGNKRYCGPLIAVSMEATAIFALRDRYNRENAKNIRAGELLLIMDHVVPGESYNEPDLSQEEFHKVTEEALILSGLEALLALRNAK